MPSRRRGRAGVLVDIAVYVIDGGVCREFLVLTVGESDGRVAVM